MISQNPEHSPYYQSDIRDAIRTRKWLRGEDMSRRTEVDCEGEKYPLRLVRYQRPCPAKRD